MTMAHPSQSNTPRLRGDLDVIESPDGRTLVVVDSISGQFTRVLKPIWDRLQHANSSGEHSPETQALWHQARQAGWTRNRTAGERKSSWSVLSIRVPLFSIHRIAGYLLPFSGLLFSFTAVLFWLFAGVLALLGLVVHWDSWAGSLPSLAEYTRTQSLVSLGCIFLLTKTAHELGHAVACQRQGGRPGVAGVWLLCLMPCPFVDVTDVWRVPNRLSRGLVMAAGIWVEWVLAILAIWVWLASESAGVRLAAMNVFLICGLSTLLFNANPLMRYDGYFVLSDLLDSPNLRMEGLQAIRQLIQLPLSCMRSVSMRLWGMSLYHLASLGYRVVLMTAIAALFVSYSEFLGAGRIMISMVLAVIAATALRSIRKWFAVLTGQGFWRLVPPMRRIALAALIAIISGLALIPFPRRVFKTGTIRCRDVESVYLPDQGVLRRVHVVVGDQVDGGDLLVEVVDSDLQLSIAQSQGDHQVLLARFDATRAATLSGNSSPNANRSTAQQWEVLRTTKRAIEAKNEDLLARQKGLQVRSSSPGIVLPPTKSDPNQVTDSMRLRPAVGQIASNQNVWCRIVTSSRLKAEVIVDADQFQRVSVGTAIGLCIPGWSHEVSNGKIAEVSPIEVRDGQVDASPSYRVVCFLDSSLDNPLSPPSLAKVVSLDGADCEVVLHCPARSLWTDLVASLRSFLGY